MKAQPEKRYLFSYVSLEVRHSTDPFLEHTKTNFNYIYGKPEGETNSTMKKGFVETLDTSKF
jgi:hypothetical protein